MKLLLLHTSFQGGFYTQMPFIFADSETYNFRNMTKTSKREA